MAVLAAGWQPRPHLFDNFLRMVTDLIDIIADPDFELDATRLPPDRQNMSPFRDRVLRRLQDRPAADWMRGLHRQRQRRRHDLPDHPRCASRPRHCRQRPAVIDQGDDGSIQLGPLARMTKTPAQPDLLVKPMTAVGRTEWRADPRPLPPSGEAAEEPPLAGLRVLEIAIVIIAAPPGGILVWPIWGRMSQRLNRSMATRTPGAWRWGLALLSVNAGEAASISLRLKSR